MAKTTNIVPEGWTLREAESLYDRLRTPRVYDRNQVNQSGKYPIIDQSESGCIGYLDEIPDFDCSQDMPLTTFANHTCAVRQMKRPFGVIQNVFPLKAKPDVSQHFLYQIINRAIPQNGYKGHYPELRETQFLTPPLPEQQKIATILSSVDDVIEKTRAQIDKLKDLKTGMMQELLTKGIGHTEFKDSPVGRIPVAWDVVNIESITTDVTYGLTVRPKYIDEGVPLVSGKECKDGWLDFSISNRISEVDFASLRTRALPSVGDVIMTKTGTIGRVALVRKHYPKFAISQNVALLKPEMSQVEPEYLLLLLTSQSVKEQIRLGVSTLSVPDLQLGTLKGFIVPLPSKNEQRSISSIINSLNDRLSGCEEKLCQYGLLKKALMQDLLTGKVRVNLTDKESAVV